MRPGRSLRTIAWVAALAGQLTGVGGAESPAEPADEAAFFSSAVAPLLARRCLDCHSAAAEVNGGLQLDLRAGWQRGGDSGPVSYTHLTLPTKA